MEKFSAQQQSRGLTDHVSLLPSWVCARKTLGPGLECLEVDASARRTVISVVIYWYPLIDCLL